MERLGRYEVGRVLGEGGAGRVHEAVLCGPGGFRKAVALKVLHSGAAELHREARIGGLLRHRNLVDVYEVGDVQGQWFCAIELCDGTLADHTPLPQRAIVEVALQVCAALQYAHEELGLVHLDLKPSNLLLADGVVKVADLGIARADGFAHDGEIRGTPGFMPPEQFAGMAVDARTDVYALGVTLAELARAPRHSSSHTLAMDTAAVAVARSDTLDLDMLEQPVPAEPTEEAPSWLAPVIERCLEPNPADRWQDMATLAEALRALPVHGVGLREAIGWVEDATTAAAMLDTNLVADKDAFVGRERELSALAAALEQPGLVTLKGPAGIGKSRLARRAAQAWYRRKRQAWFVELAEVRSADELVASIALTLRVQLAQALPEERLDALVHAVGSRGPVVLVLDNFEQITQLAPMLDRFRDAAPELRLLVTSREPLRLAGEVLLEVGPVTPEVAVALLVERARGRGVVLEPDAELAELAAVLEGWPLALELAAGRLGVLSVREVLDRMGLSLLRRGTGGRHDTLLAALDWSWELLSPVERSALAQLSVFVGGFTLEAAEEVLELGHASVLDTLTALVDRSMVRSASEVRFNLLTSVSAYAADKLEDAEPVEVRHGRFYAAFGHPDFIEGLELHGGVLRRRVLAEEQGNLAQACRRACARVDATTAARTLAAAHEAVALTGPFAEVLALVDAVFALGGALGEERASVELSACLAVTATEASDRASGYAQRAIDAARATGNGRLERKALCCLANVHRTMDRLDLAIEGFEDLLERVLQAHDRLQQLHCHAGLGLCHATLRSHDEAERHYLAALSLARSLGHRVTEASMLGNMAGTHQQRGEFDLARACYDAALGIMREVGSTRSEAIWLGNLGILLRLQGRLEEAEQHYRIAVRGHRLSGNRGYICSTLGNLGRVLAEQGRLAEAREVIEEAFQIAVDLKHRHSEAVAVANLAGLAASEGDPVEARRLLEMGQKISEELQDPMLIEHFSRQLAAD